MLHAVIGGSFLRRPPSLPSLLSSASPPTDGSGSLAASSFAAAAHAGSLAASPPAGGSSAAALGGSPVALDAALGCLGAAAPEHDARTMIARLRKVDMFPPRRQRALIGRYSRRAVTFAAGYIGRDVAPRASAATTDFFARLTSAAARPSAAAVAGTSVHASSQCWSSKLPPVGGEIVIASELSDPEMPIATPCSWRPTSCVISLVITGRSTPLPNAAAVVTAIS